jgi:hypothetical protein
MPIGSACEDTNCVRAPLVVMRPILLRLESVNQSAPSGPVAISVG